MNDDGARKALHSTGGEQRTSYEAYGVQCEEGWKGLYQPLIDRCIAEGVTILQVKEKFGVLKIYVAKDGGVPDDLASAIRDAVERSTSICEICGAPGELRTRPGRVQTLCLAHSSDWPC